LSLNRIMNHEKNKKEREIVILSSDVTWLHTLRSVHQKTEEPTQQSNLTCRIQKNSAHPLGTTSWKEKSLKRNETRCEPGYVYFNDSTYRTCLARVWTWTQQTMKQCSTSRGEPSAVAKGLVMTTRAGYLHCKDLLTTP
jgi:hypothetical protein